MVSETIHFDSFGAYLKHHRMVAKVSRRELAEALDISANRVADVERGKAPLRSGKMLAVIKQVVPSVCEVSLCQLYMQDLVDRLVERHDLAGLVCDIVVE